MAEKVTFEPNTPIEMRLKYRDGKPVSGNYGPQMYYTLVDGRGMYLDTDVALAVTELRLSPNEPFVICKKWNGQRGKKPEWHVYRVEETTARKQPQPARPTVQAEVRGTGTYGPVPVPRLALAVSTPPLKVPYNVAFQEILQFVTAGLQAAGEQWNDEAKQGLVSTILIQGARDGYLTIWERR